MVTKARQQYFADETSIKKRARTFNLDEALVQKINDIDARAEENVIEIVKVNAIPLPVDAHKAVDVTVPGVVDSLDSWDGNSSLSANQGRILYEYILNLQSRGRFLSNWDCVNGTPVTAPFGSGYTYNPGDYYVVGIVDTVDPSDPHNLRPDGPVYIAGTPSQVYESETVEVSDMYVWDGSDWLLLKNTARQIAVDATLSTTSTNPVQNKVITNELNRKQDLLTPGTNITIDPNTNEISATGYDNLPAAQGGTDNTLVTTGDKYNWNNKQDRLQAGANIQIVGNRISATDTTYPNLPEAQGGQNNSLVTDGDKYRWNHKQNALTPGDNIQIVNGVISATDTTYSAGTGITIEDNVISADMQAAQWGHITGNINDQLDLKNALDEKQNLLAPGANIQIVNDMISATDTTYSAGDGIAIVGTTINNVAMFDPDNVGGEGQVLTKRENGSYRWADPQGGGGSGGEVDNTPFGPSWNERIAVAPSQNAVYDKISAMDIIIAGKQDLLEAGENIQINGNVISATDTTYTAADFDIKDLADSTGLRATWSNKQDKILDLDTIRAGAAKGMTALQPGRVDNVSELINDAGYLTKAVSDLTNYYTKNETYTKTEIQNLISNLGGYEVVSTLPATGNTRIIYLLGPSANNNYEEYIYTNNQWVKIGDTTMDLTNYFHKVNDDSDDVREGSTHLFMTPTERSKLAGLQNETRTTIMNKLGAANSTRSGYLTSTDWNIFNNKQDELVAGDNITIRGNVISADVDCPEYSAGSGISISGDVISNTKQFSPANNGSTGQVLTKTSSGYRWEPAQGGGGGGVTSVNNQTGDVIINEFSPTNAGAANQVLTKTSGNSYAWTTISTPSSDSNVKLFTLSGINDLQTAQDAYNWFAAGKLPIVKLNAEYTYSTHAGNAYLHNDFIFIPEPSSITGAHYLTFFQVNDWDNAENLHVTNTGYSRTLSWQLVFTISDGGVVSAISTPEGLSAFKAYLSPTVNYATPYEPLYPGSPATKKYVDDKFTGSAPVTLTYADPLVVDMSQSLNYVLTLTGECHISFTNITAGQVYQIVVIQDANGGHRLTLPNNFKYASGYAQDTTANSVSKLILDYIGGNYFASITRYS